MEKIIQKIIGDKTGLTFIDIKDGVTIEVDTDDLVEMLRCAWLDGNAAPQVRKVKANG